MIFQMWNGAWNKHQFKVCQVAQASVAYDDKHSTLDPVMVGAGWPHSSRDKIPCIFPEFSLCYEFFPCVFFHKINRWFWVIKDLAGL